MAVSAATETSDLALGLTKISLGQDEFACQV